MNPGCLDFMVNYKIKNREAVNYGLYSNPYFRVVTHLPISGQETPVDCFMYNSQEAYNAGSSYIACFPFYVNNISASLDNNAN